MYEITIPQNVEELGQSAFYGCTELHKIDIPENLRVVEDWSFNGCISLEEIHLPDRLERIGFSAFWGCNSLCEVVVPEGVKEIGKCAYGWCNCLRTVHLPDSLEDIGSNAFVGCLMLQTINIPKNVRHIGLRILNGCSSLADIIVETPSYFVQGEMLISCRGYIVSYWGEDDTLTLPEGVSCIYGHVTGSCEVLRVPYGLTEVLDEEPDIPAFSEGIIQSIVIPKKSRNAISRLCQSYCDWIKLLVEE